MIAYGMPTLLELPRIADCARLCGELRLQFVELNMCLPQYQPERLDTRQLAELARQYGIFYTIHLDDTNTPCDFNDRIARAYTDTVLETIDIAKRVGIPVLNMHLSLGTHFTLPERKVLLFEEYAEEYARRLTAFRDACERAIGAADITICVENTRAFCHPVGEKSLALLLKSPVFGLTLDTGHDACGRFAQSAVIEQYSGRLRHMHLHDALMDAQRDHLPLGEGELDLSSDIALARRQRCRVVVEVKTVAGLRKSLRWLNSRGEAEAAGGGEGRP